MVDQPSDLNLTPIDFGAWAIGGGDRAFALIYLIFGLDK
jgi:hypothetical protein